MNRPKISICSSPRRQRFTPTFLCLSTVYILHRDVIRVGLVFHVTDAKKERESTPVRLDYDLVRAWRPRKITRGAPKPALLRK